MLGQAAPGGALQGSLGAPAGPALLELQVAPPASNGRAGPWEGRVSTVAVTSGWLSEGDEAEVGGQGRRGVLKSSLLLFGLPEGRVLTRAGAA